MRKYLWIRLMMLVLASFGVTNLALAGKEFSPGRALIASGHPEWPPVMVKEGKNVVGAGPELARKIFSDLGIKVEVPYSGSWEDVLNKAKAGQIDLVVAAYKTREREAHFIYSDAYTTDPVVVFVPADKTFKFTTFSDLVGKSGIGMSGDSYGQKFDDYSATHLNLKRVHTVAEALNLIVDHKADYFIYSLYAGKVEIKKNQRAKITHLPHFISEQKFYMMISKKSRFASYMPEVNRLIKKYVKDGTVDRLVGAQEGL